MIGRKLFRVFIHKFSLNLVSHQLSITCSLRCICLPIQISIYTQPWFSLLIVRRLHLRRDILLSPFISLVLLLNRRFILFLCISLFLVLLFALTENRMFKVVEWYHYHCYVIKGSSEKWVLQNVLNSHSALFVNVRGKAKALIIFDTVPNTFDCFFVAEFIKDTIACKDQEIMFVCYLELLDFWGGNNHVRVSSILLHFGFNVTESPWYW